MDRPAKLLWTVERPGGAKTAHQPVPLDLDGDGRQEVIAGYGVLNPDGSLRWLFETPEQRRGAGHLDCVRVVDAGTRPQDSRLAMTGCGANWLAMVDVSAPAGAGGRAFRVGGHRPARSRLARPPIVVDVAHEKGVNLTWVIGRGWHAVGSHSNRSYSRFHELIDWTGDGLDEIVMGDSGAVIDGSGKVVAVPTCRSAGSSRS